MIKNLQEVEQTCRKLKPLIGDVAEYLYYEYLTGSHASKQEISDLIDITFTSYLKKPPLSQNKIILEPPSPDSDGEFFIGNILYNGEPYNNQQLYLQKEDFIKQVGVFAITAEGKTNLAFLMALQLLKKKIPFLVIDWKRTWRNLFSLKEQIPELEDVLIFTIGKDKDTNPSPFKWNPFRAPPGTNNRNWVGNVAAALERSHLSGPGVYYHLCKIFNQLFNAMPENTYPSFSDGYREILKKSASGRELYWKQSGERVCYDFTYGNDIEAFNSRHPVQFEKLLDKPVIIEIDMELPDWQRVFFSEVILRWIHLYRLTQLETDELRHVLFLEEAHNFFQKKAFHREIPSLENIYREIRAFGQGLVTVTQHPSMLPVWVLGNCHTQIYLGLQHEDDITQARKSMFLNYQEQEYFNLLKTGECIIKVRGRINPCHVKIPFVPVSKGEITDTWIKENARGYLPFVYEGLKELPDTDLTHAINRLNHPDFFTTESYNLLLDVLKFPLSSVTERYSRLNLNPNTGNFFKTELQNLGYIKPIHILTKHGRVVLLQLTNKALLYFRDKGFDTDLNLYPNESLEHLFWKTKLYETNLSKVNQSWIEFELDNHRIDYVTFDNGIKKAFEIETGRSNAISNIKKLLKYDFDEIISVAVNRIVQKKILNQLSEINLKDDRIKICSVLDFDIPIQNQKL